MSFLAAAREVFCTFEVKDTKCCGYANTCSVNENIDSENYILGSEFNNTVEQFYMSYNSRVKSVPRQIGAKFPNLKEFRFYKCGLTIVRNYYFKDMRNLQRISLGGKQITTFESDAFKDLIKLEGLFLHENMIETLDDNLFATMVNLKEIYLHHNKIKFLSPKTFKISSNLKLVEIDLRWNKCIDGRYLSEHLNQLERDLRANC